MTQTQQVAHIYFFHILKKFGSFCSSARRNATSPHTLVKNTGIQYKKLVHVIDHVTCECNPHKHPQTECKQSLAWLSIRTGVHELEKCVVFPLYNNEKACHHALAPLNLSQMLYSIEKT